MQVDLAGKKRALNVPTGNTCEWNERRVVRRESTIVKGPNERASVAEESSLFIVSVLQCSNDASALRDSCGSAV